MKKELGETQTLRAGRSNEEPKIFDPAADPFPGARDGQNLISWRWSLPSPTDPVWWGSMHAFSNYRGKRPTPTTHTNGQDRLQYTAPQLARSVTRPAFSRVHTTLRSLIPRNNCYCWKTSGKTYTAPPNVTHVPHLQTHFSSSIMLPPPKRNHNLT